MSDTLIPRDQVKFREVNYLKTSDHGPVEKHTYAFKLVLPEPLASWDVYDYWEKERTLSIQQHLNKGDVLFDIGAEHGWLSVIYAQFVGAENIVLMEPTPEFWPNIQATWEANGLAKPKSFYDGLISDKTTDDRSAFAQWPEAAADNKLIDKLKYVYIHEHGETPQITIDDYVERTGIIPDALTMDTEGAEILILKGAEKTLRKHKPLVWVSEHPDLALRDYSSDVKEIHEFMSSLGYRREYLATDHEVHALYRAGK